MGKVIQKNEPAIALSPLSIGYLSAVRHGNGRDWWVFTPQNANNKYYRLLLTPQGIGPVTEQAIGYTWDEIDWSGQSCFSPDGARYARFHWKHGLHIFDFDRCSGLLSNPVHLTFPDETFYTAGVAISPNSRYLYAAAETRLYQFDLQAPDIAASKVLVGEYDGQPFPYYGSFYFAQLAADGRIYIAPAGSHQHLHIIDRPNEAGAACNFLQHGLALLTFNFTAIPNFPNYRLGALPGSPCDSLSVSSTNVRASLPAVEIFPNPGSGQFRLQWTAEVPAVRVVVMDALGRQCIEQVVDSTGASLDLTSLSAGVYRAGVVFRDGQRVFKVLVKQ